MDEDFDALYAAAYVRPVRLLALASGSQPDAEEVVQETFLRLIPRWSRVRSYAVPEAWVRGVAFRLLSNRRRARRAAARTLVRHGPPSEVDPPGSDRVDVERALNALPAHQRHAVVLHHLLGLPVEQIAAELRVPVGIVKSRFSRGRAALADDPGAPCLSSENFWPKRPSATRSDPSRSRRSGGAGSGACWHAPAVRSRCSRWSAP